ncbi:MAG: NAD-dependent epimerase/dehydratase family protein, partial [Pseudomonadota bacterium]
MAESAGRRVLVLGAYGMIGSAVVEELRAAGQRVTGLGRDPHAAARVHPDLDWIIRDLSGLQQAEEWILLLGPFDVVVNCAGALQDGARDDLAAVHEQQDPLFRLLK